MEVDSIRRKALLACITDLNPSLSVTNKTLHNSPKEWKPQARMGTHSVMGLFGDTCTFAFNFVHPQTIP